MRKRPSVDIVILTIREDEFEAVLAEFPEQDGTFQGRRHYSMHRLATRECEYRIAVLRQIEQGNGEAQDAARDAIEDFKPSLLVVTGIAGGLPSDDFTLGDVVLSSRVIDYSVEARSSGSEPTYSLSGGPVSREIANGLTVLPARKEWKNWHMDLPAKPAFTLGKRGQLYGPTTWRESVKNKLQHALDIGRFASPPKPIVGSIASSDRLIKDPLVLFPWVQTARNLLAVEMESGGVYRAARERCAMVAIRGISDIVGLKRDDVWTKYACKSAAAFTRAYLALSPVKARSVRATGKGNPKPNSPRQDYYLVNLFPLTGYPQQIYVSATNFSTRDQVRSVLREKTERTCPPWVINTRQIYTFVPPASCGLEWVAIPKQTRIIDSNLLAQSPDPDQRRLFVQLLNLCLTDDLRKRGIRYFSEDRVYAFLKSKPNEKDPLGDRDRTVDYQNVIRRSKITVVKKYPVATKDGGSFHFYRHNAFQGQFRVIGKSYFLQLNPTHFYTDDGFQRNRFHSKRLSGIKRLERNRAVLSQMLLWVDVLCSKFEDRRPTILEFGVPAKFEAEPDAAVQRETYVSLGDEGTERLTEQLLLEFGVSDEDLFFG